MHERTLLEKEVQRPVQIWLTLFYGVYIMDNISRYEEFINFIIENQEDGTLKFDMLPKACQLVFEGWKESKKELTNSQNKYINEILNDSMQAPIYLSYMTKELESMLYPRIAKLASNAQNPIEYTKSMVYNIFCYKYFFDIIGQELDNQNYNIDEDAIQKDVNTKLYNIEEIIIKMINKNKV